MQRRPGGTAGGDPEQGRQDVWSERRCTSQAATLAPPVQGNGGTRRATTDAHTADASGSRGSSGSSGSWGSWGSAAAKWRLPQSCATRSTHLATAGKHVSTAKATCVAKQTAGTSIGTTECGLLSWPLRLRFHCCMTFASFLHGCPARQISVRCGRVGVRQCTVGVYTRMIIPTMHFHLSIQPHDATVAPYHRIESSRRTGDWARKNAIHGQGLSRPATLIRY